MKAITALKRRRTYQDSTTVDVSDKVPDSPPETRPATPVS